MLLSLLVIILTVPFIVAVDIVKLCYLFIISLILNNLEATWTFDIVQDSVKYQ